MRWIYTLPLRLRSLFRRNAVEQELGEELRDHLDHLVEQNLRSGMSEAEAGYAAKCAMDGITQRMEDCRDARRVNWIEDFFKDLRYAARAMWRSPIFAITAILSLALGIGANSAIFTAVDAVLWRPLPVERPHELVRFATTSHEGRLSSGLPFELSTRLQKRTDVFDGAMAVTYDGLSFTYDGRAERVMGSAVSGKFLTFLGVRTVLGEPFSTSVREGHWAAETVLSYRFWMNRFGGDPSVIGRVIHLNTYPFTIVGVSEPSFYDVTRGADPEVRIPRMPDGQKLKEMELVSGGDDFSWSTMVRLKNPGITPAEAAAVADAEFQEILRRTKSPEAQRGRHVTALPGDRGWPDLLQEFSAPLFVLFGLVGGVLAIACANVASMLLARATARHRELAVRCSIGAGRGRLIRQMLTESMLLSIGGAGLGIAAAYWTGPILLRFLPRSNITLAIDLHPDARALWFTLGLSIVTGILFGLVPALHATRGDLAGSLKTESPSSTGDTKTAFLRKGLVSAQVAFSLALLIAAGLFVRSATNLRPKNPGVDPNRVLQFMIKPQLEIYSDAKKHTLMAELHRRIGEVPGVESVTLAQPGPFTGSASTWWAHVPGREAVRMAGPDSVSAGFIQTFGLRLIAGRDFSATDKPGSPLVAVINQKLARELFGSENALGRSFQIDSKGDAAGTYQVIGVIADANYWNLRGAPDPMAFITYQNFAPYMPVVHVRVSNPDTASMFTAIRRVFDEVDTGFPVFNVKTQTMQIDDATSHERIVANFAAAFGVLALVLAAVGLYGILAYSMTRRTREIGIRMALGSGSSSVVWLMAKDALLLVAVGGVAGIATALLASRLFAAYLYGISPADPGTIAISAAAMLAIAMLAVSIPAWRAARIDPLRALRHD